MRRSLEGATFLSISCGATCCLVSDHSGQDPLGSVPISHYFKNSADTVKLSVSGIIIPKRKVQEGILLKSTSAVWREVADKLGADWMIAYQLIPDCEVTDSSGFRRFVIHLGFTI